MTSQLQPHGRQCRLHEQAAARLLAFKGSDGHLSTAVLLAHLTGFAAELQDAAHVPRDPCHLRATAPKFYDLESCEAVYSSIALPVHRLRKRPRIQHMPEVTHTKHPDSRHFVARLRAE